jgi:hypothetical protein
MTKLRIIFVQPGHVFKGKQAVRMLCQHVRKKVLDTAWPVGFESFNKERKLSFLGTLLPTDCKLVLIRELKHTRTNKSRYVQMLSELRATMPPVTGEAPQAVNPARDRIQWQIGPPDVEAEVPWAVPVHNGQNPDLQNQRLDNIVAQARRPRPNRPRTPERP